MKAWVSSGLGHPLFVSAIARSIDGAVLHALEAKALLEPGVISWDDFRSLGAVLMARRIVVVCPPHQCRPAASIPPYPSICVRSDDITEIEACLASEGQRISPEAALAIIHVPVCGDPRISPTERRIASLIARSATTKEIAAALKTERKSVENHRANIMRKLHLRDAAGVTRWAIREGIAEA